MTDLLKLILVILYWLVGVTTVVTIARVVIFSGREGWLFHPPGFWQGVIRGLTVAVGILVTVVAWPLTHLVIMWLLWRAPDVLACPRQAEAVTMVDRAEMHTAVLACIGRLVSARTTDGHTVEGVVSSIVLAWDHTVGRNFARVGFTGDAATRHEVIRITHGHRLILIG